MLYFDHAASSPLMPEVFDVLLEAQKDDFYNISAKYRASIHLAKRVESCRETFLDEVNITNGKFIFTASATESNNTIIKGLKLSAKSQLWYSPGDHPSLTRPMEFVSKYRGLELLEIPLDEKGLINWKYWGKLLKEKNNNERSLITLTHIDGQRGNKQNLKEHISKLKSEIPFLWFHLDAVQSFGKFPIDLENLCIDSMSVSAHKIGGPKGIAGLYLAAGGEGLVIPLLHGGGQEKGMRSSTVAAPLIFSFEKALQIQKQKREEKIRKAFVLRDQLERGLSCLDINIEFPFSLKDYNPYILGCCIDKISSDIILRKLEERGCIIASSAACSSKNSTKNEALEVLGWDLKKQKSFLRISFCPETTDEEIDKLLYHFQDVLRELSPLIKSLESTR